MAKMDNVAEIAQHVSPTVAATKFAQADGARDILDTDAGVKPSAVGTDGMVQGIEGKTVGFDTNEN